MVHENNNSRRCGITVLADYVITWKRNPSHYGEYLKEVTKASKKNKSQTKNKIKKKNKTKIRKEKKEKTNKLKINV